MYSTTLDNSPLIKINGGKHDVTYALNGTQMNPLEAFYAALAGCAGVFAIKACKGLGIPAEGIEISCKPFAGPGGPLTLAKYKTEVRFPAGFTAEQKAEVLKSIEKCAVKEIVASGPNIDFSVTEV